MKEIKYKITTKELTAVSDRLLADDGYNRKCNSLVRILKILKRDFAFREYEIVLCLRKVYEDKEDEDGQG